jgi:predicted ATPase
MSLNLEGLAAACSGPDSGRATGFPDILSSRINAIIAAHGGRTEPRPNHEWRAIFGTEQAREDDPARAVQTALKLLSFLADLQPEGLPPLLSVKIGIHTGMVTLGLPISEKADTARRDNIALASRLQACAPPGIVVISQDTYRHVYGLFDVETMPLARAADRNEPIQAYRVLNARPRSLARTLRGVEGAETEMVGRKQELDLLKSAFSMVVEKQKLQIVTILGEAGIGKSRLLHEFEKWLQVVPSRARLLCGRADSESAKLPFSLMRDVFCARFEIQESDSMALASAKFASGFVDLLGVLDLKAEQSKNAALQARFVGQFLGFDFSDDPAIRSLLNDPQQIKDRGLGGIGRFFASTGPSPSGTADDDAENHADVTLLVLEDLHWSDDDSLDLLTHLMQTCQHYPLMILALARPTLLERRPSWGERNANQARLDLGPLSTHESELLVQIILRKAPNVPTTFRDLILADAEGNPFYIEEIIKMFIEEKVIVPGPARWRLEPNRLASVAVPPTLAGVLQARLDGLPSLERAMLQRASVVGHVFWDAAIKGMGALSEVLPSMDNSNAAVEQRIQQAFAALCSKELIHRRQFSGFADAVEFSFKHELLRNVAYEGLPNKERREYHAQTADWLIQHSGERIKEVAGLVAVHFEQAGKLASAADWYGQAGQQARSGYAPVAAIEYFKKALSLPASAPAPSETNSGARLEWYEGLSDALATQARFTEALESYGKVREMAETVGDLAMQASAWNGFAFLHERRGDNRASVDAAETAELLARRAGVGSRAELIRALHLKGWASYRLGDAPTVLSLATQTLRLCEESGDRYSMPASFKLFGVAHLQLGHYQEADRYFQLGLSLCLELGDRRNAGAMFSNLGESARLRGDHQAAVELYQKALAVAREIGDRPSEAIYLNNLSGALLGLGQFKEAETGLREAIALTAVPKSCSLSETYSFLARACLSQGKLSEALDAAQLAVTIAKESENHLDLGGSWRVLGQIAAAIGYKAPGAESRCPDPANIVLEVAEPASYFAESLRVFKKIGAEGERAATLMNWAAYELQQGRVAESRAKSEEARQILARAGL